MSHNWASLNILPDGNLEMTLSEKDRAEIDWQGLYRNGSEAALWELLEGEMGNGWAEVKPEWVSALTEAPIITNDIEYPDSGKPVVCGAVWWFPNYAVEDPVATLRKEGCVVFTRAADAPDVILDCELCQRQGCETCNGTGIIFFDWDKKVMEKAIEELESRNKLNY